MTTDPSEPRETTGSRPHGTRTRGREVALKYLYATDFTGTAAIDFEEFVVQQGERGLAVEFARHLVKGTLDVVETLDEELRKLAANWSLSRMAVVDRNVLRLGCYELLYEDTPPRVVINEAVELAKKYGTAQSGAFVNGILDQVRRRRES